MKPERCTICLAGLHAGVIEPECIPVPWFGALSDRVAAATVGLNPALTEWQHEARWRPTEWRLPILGDFAVADRGKLTDFQLAQVEVKRTAYFGNKPHSYFDPLELLLQCANPAWSYHTGTAIHLDLVACATTQRWGLLRSDAKAVLTANCAERLRQTLRLVPAQTILLLNGKPARDGLLEAVTPAGVTPRDDDIREISGASGTTGFAGHVSVTSSSLRYFGWSTPLSKATGPAALAIALWIRHLAGHVECGGNNRGASN
jgi:hypothetical protein